MHESELKNRGAISIANEEQNIFYSSISKYYAEIFPFKPVQLGFVQNEIGGNEGKKILDIGCATGELAAHLAEMGADVTGVDLNEDLLKQAKSKFNQPHLHFQKRNMLELKSDFSPGQFDAVLCFGNTLVHLPTEEMILKMLQSVFAILKPGRKFLLQILNYDYILNERISELPLIETKTIRFNRKYRFSELPMLPFETELYIKQSGTLLKNETLLFALKSNYLRRLLNVVGFSEINLYSDFRKKPQGGSHLPLVLSCSKPDGVS